MTLYHYLACTATGLVWATVFSALPKPMPVMTGGAAWQLPARSTGDLENLSPDGVTPVAFLVKISDGAENTQKSIPLFSKQPPGRALGDATNIAALPKPDSYPRIALSLLEADDQLFDTVLHIPNIY